MGPGVSDLAGALRQLVEAFGRSAIPFMIVGSMASVIHSICRTTFNVDFVADIDSAQFARLRRELGDEFYTDGSFNLIHYATSYKFDIFPLTSDPYQQTQFSRRTVRDLYLKDVYLPLPVATAEDALLMQLTERQWNDVRVIIAVQRDRLDREYLTKWAAYLKVADLLDEALQLT